MQENTIYPELLEIIQSNKLTSNEFKLYVLLRTIASEGIGYIFASNATLLKMIHWKPTMLTEALKGLEDKKFITRHNHTEYRKGFAYPRTIMLKGSAPITEEEVLKLHSINVGNSERSSVKLASNKSSKRTKILKYVS